MLISWRMLLKIPGYLFAAIGFLGLVFFRQYKGSVIPYPTLWLVACLLIGWLGAYLIVRSGYRSVLTKQRTDATRLQHLKKRGERIVLNPDNCEIKENNYYEEVIPENTTARQIDALYDPNRNYRQIHIKQSAIVYYYIKPERKIKMVSRPFDCSGNQLRGELDQKKIMLYIDPSDPTNYAFEMLA